ncbi:MAG: 3-deoxy-7-phosphoheptulonate synthase [Burkholderiales bacterium]
MDQNRIYNVNILSLDVLAAPGEIKEALPLSARAEKTVFEARLSIEQILDRRDRRLLVVVGPCSIHDPIAAMDYAHRLKRLADELSDTLLVVMRVYFEKPRTTTGWKGMINDPHMDDSFEIEEGLKKARKLLLYFAELGLPAGTEALDPMSPQYLSDLVSWSAIGARTTESQTHRELASGLSMPVGFKNGTDGGLQVAINAMLSAQQPHSFLGINHRGQVAVVRTKGNAYGHMILRGGGNPNYDAASIELAEAALAKQALPGNIVIDCSHANSSKDPSRQPQVLDDVVKQIISGNQSIVGVMLESNIHAGNQAIPVDLSLLRYGVSVTDGCIDWPTTETCLQQARSALKEVVRNR